MKDTGSKVVIIDTLSRAFHGDVTNADVNLCWNHFVMPLKRMEDVTLIWLDHTGHDESHVRRRVDQGPTVGDGVGALS